MSVIASIIHATYRAIDTTIPVMYAHVASSGLMSGHATARNAVAMNSMNGSLCTISRHVFILLYNIVSVNGSVREGMYSHVNHDISPVEINVTR